MQPRHQSGSSWSSARLDPRCRRWALLGRSIAPPTHAPDGSCSLSGPPCTTRTKKTTHNLSHYFERQTVLSENIDVKIRKKLDTFNPRKQIFSIFAILSSNRFYYF